MLIIFSWKRGFCLCALGLRRLYIIRIDVRARTTAYPLHIDATQQPEMAEIGAKVLKKVMMRELLLLKRTNI